MLKILLLLTLGAFLFVGVVCGLVLLPFLLLAVVFRVAVFAVTVPLRILGALFGLVFGVLTWVGAVLMGLLSLLAVVVMIVGGVVAAPLILMIAAVFAVWLLARLVLPRFSTT